MAERARGSGRSGVSLRLWRLALLLGLALLTGSTVAEPLAAADPSVDQILARNLEARGGEAVWGPVRSMAWIGHIESERLGDQTLAFSLEEVWPNKTRFDILGAHGSQRIFNGSKGWTVHQREDGLPEVEPYSALEERYARESPTLAAPLISYRRQMREVRLLGHDMIDGLDCYRLGVRLPSGAMQFVWVDTQSYLERRFDRPTYSRDGKPGMVTVRYRDYQAQGGLQLATTLEIGGAAAAHPDRLVIERVAVNPEIAETRFTKPAAPPHRHEITLMPDRAGQPGH